MLRTSETSKLTKTSVILGMGGFYYLWGYISTILLWICKFLPSICVCMLLSCGGGVILQQGRNGACVGSSHRVLQVL